MAVRIEEILGRSNQGMTMPFICRGEDDQIYFVKGRGAGRRSQVAEWVSGRLAQLVELPIAEFSLVEVPSELIEVRSRNDLAQLGSGLAFGSVRRSVVELTTSQLSQVPDQTKIQVLAFDWWIQNMDRTLTERGGNPNLFFDPGLEALVVIDHNQAFDPEFDSRTFLDSHAFSGVQNALFYDFVNRNEFRQVFCDALMHWEEIIGSLPDEWHFVDDEKTVPAHVDLAAVKQILNRCDSDDLWRMQ